MGFFMAYKPIIHEGFKGDNGLINNWFFKGIEIMAEISLSSNWDILKLIKLPLSSHYKTGIQIVYA